MDGGEAHALEDGWEKDGQATEGDYSPLVSTGFDIPQRHEDVVEADMTDASSPAGSGLLNRPVPCDLLLLSARACSVEAKPLRA
ncbi:hypothetical protein DL769_000914 [Monosporascus sp. CRB-8-3]|nr:hypothetical protein DL769_000914 [Monosporascus sp. CRB-8-3]